MKVANPLLYVAILSALLLANRAPAQPPPVSFVATPGFAADDATAIVAADLNGDGIPTLRHHEQG
jgi:hypothetical protein